MDEVRDSMALEPHGAWDLAGEQPFLDGRPPGVGVWMGDFWLW